MRGRSFLRLAATWLAAVAALLVALLLGVLLGRRLGPHDSPAVKPTPASPKTNAGASSDLTPTQIFAHNLELRKGPEFRVYIAWISGELERTHGTANPSFDDPDSFLLNIRKGVIRANIGDIANYLNSVASAKAPMQHIEIRPDGDRLHIRGTMKKVVSLPVEVTGTLTPVADGQVQFHVEKISVLRVPLKGLLGTFDVKLADLMRTTQVPGVTVNGNDIVFNTERLLPPPHIRGEMTAVNVKPPDIEVIYGNAANDAAALAQWHNFLRFTGGAINFGRLTMHDSDLTMIDAVNEPWFYLDLVNYQSQVTNGYTRMTAQGGLEIFMPSLSPKGQPGPAPRVTLEWLKNRNSELPEDVARKTGVKR